MSNPVGRPRKWASPEELQAKIDEYFESVKEPRCIGETIYWEPVTITGLALALDTTRETLCDYQNNDEFSYTIKRAKLRCENYAERQLYLGKSAAGPIFSLKNFGWSDSQDVNLGGQKDGVPIDTNMTVTFISANQQLNNKINDADIPAITATID